MAKAEGWAFRESNAGFGSFEAMVKTVQGAITGRDFLLGSLFSMAEVIYGGTLNYMVRFKLLEPLPEFTDYIRRLEQRPAWQRATAINARSAQEHGLV